MDLLTLDDVAARVRKTTRGIRKDMAAGRFGPAIVRLGRCVRIRADELSAWIAADCPPRATWLTMRDEALTPAAQR